MGWDWVGGRLSREGGMREVRDLLMRERNSLNYVSMDQIIYVLNLHMHVHTYVSSPRTK